MKDITNKTTPIIIPGIMLGFTLLSGAVLSASKVNAEDTDVIDQLKITVPISCTMSGTGMNTHNATINNGTYNSAIGETTIKAFCNDDEGFAIYAVGFTDDEAGKNVLTNSSLGSTFDISTGTQISGNTSQWAMKLAATSGTYTPIIAGSNADTGKEQGDPDFTTFQEVPDTYTKVAYKPSSTDTGTNAEGSTLTTTYQAYISSSQPSGTYTGQVKYALIHPSTAVAGKLNITYNANGITFTNGKSKNTVTYDATYNEKIARSIYDENGNFNNYGTPGGNSVITIPGAESIHIKVTYGTAQYYSGPPSDLYIWAGNHPDYTNLNNNTSLISCGGISTTDGAFHSTGGQGTQVTMECDIADSSVTFYDYSVATNGTYSNGYYARVYETGIAPYTKNTISGTYMTPDTEDGNYEFLGWALTPDATEPTYVDNTSIIDAPLTNDNGSITLYAIWNTTFNGYVAHADKTKYNGYYKIQDMSTSICTNIPENLVGELIDERDNEIYKVTKLADGNCWMLENLRLDPTDPTTAANMSAQNTNASTEAIYNLLHGGSTTTGWSNVPVANVDSDFWNGGLVAPRINNSNKNVYVNIYGPATTNRQSKAGIYYNYCALSVGTYCHSDYTSSPESGEDICPSGWKVPTSNEYENLSLNYERYTDSVNSYSYNISLAKSGTIYSSIVGQNQYGSLWSSTVEQPTQGGSGSIAHMIGENGTHAQYSRYYGSPIRCSLNK